MEESLADRDARRIAQGIEYPLSLFAQCRNDTLQTGIGSPVTLGSEATAYFELDLCRSQNGVFVLHKPIHQIPSLRLLRTSLLVLLDYRKRLLLMGCRQNFPVLQSDGFSILNRPGLLQQIQ